MSVPAFRVRSFDTSGPDWVSIIVPSECRHILIENTHANASMQMTGTDGDGSVRYLRAGEEFPMDFSAGRIKEGVVACLCKGAGPAVVTFTL